MPHEGPPIIQTPEKVLSPERFLGDTDLRVRVDSSEIALNQLKEVLGRGSWENLSENELVEISRINDNISKARNLLEDSLYRLSMIAEK